MERLFRQNRGSERKLNSAIFQKLSREQITATAEAGGESLVKRFFGRNCKLYAVNYSNRLMHDMNHIVLGLGHWQLKNVGLSLASF